MHYLNYAGSSYPKPPSVHQAVSLALAAEPCEHAELFERSSRSILDEFRHPEGQKLPGRLILSSGCTASLALVVQRLPHRKLVLTSQLEHQALLQPIQTMEQQGVVEHRELSYRPGQPVDLDELARLLRGNNVGVVAVSSASNITGELLPLAQIAELTRKHDAVLVVDAAQSFGTDHFPAVCKSADVIVAGGHKAALGPQGIGLIFAGEHVDFLAAGAVCEIGEEACSTFPGYCEVGSVNLAGACGLAAGLESTRGRRAEIAERTRGFAAELRAALAAESSVRLLGPQTPRDALGIVSLMTTDLRLERLQEMMLHEGMQIRVGTHCAERALEVLGAKGGCARISFGEASDASAVRAVVEFFERR